MEETRVLPTKEGRIICVSAYIRNHDPASKCTAFASLSKIEPRPGLQAVSVFSMREWMRENMYFETLSRRDIEE